MAREFDRFDGYGHLRDPAEFASLAARFAARLDAIRHCTDARYVRSDWARRNTELERVLLPEPAPDYLSHPAIRCQMLVDDHLLVHELPFVCAHLEDTGLLAEDPAGRPPTVRVPGTEVWTSSNTVHQLYHLMRYQEATGNRLRDAETIVEWGGGFGSLMRLLVRVHGGAPTCVIIDTPTFSALQWLYLSEVLGEERVVLHSTGPPRPVSGLVNIVPIGLVRDMEVRADLFISNWALNESMPAAQQDVVERHWFGAASLLMAMHAGDPFAEVALGSGARAVLIGAFMPGQQYLVA
jgi:hypothetical protein